MLQLARHAGDGLSVGFDERRVGSQQKAADAGLGVYQGSQHVLGDGVDFLGVSDAFGGVIRRQPMTMPSAISAS